MRIFIFIHLSFFSASLFANTDASYKVGYKIRFFAYSQWSAYFDSKEHACLGSGDLFRSDPVAPSWAKDSKMCGMKAGSCYVSLQDCSKSSSWVEAGRNSFVSSTEHGCLSWDSAGRCSSMCEDGHPKVIARLSINNCDRKPLKYCGPNQSSKRFSEFNTVPCSVCSDDADCQLYVKNNALNCKTGFSTKVIFQSKNYDGLGELSRPVASCVPDGGDGGGSGGGSGGGDLSGVNNRLDSLVEINTKGFKSVDDHLSGIKSSLDTISSSSSSSLLEFKKISSGIASLTNQISSSSSQQIVNKVVLDLQADSTVQQALNAQASALNEASPITSDQLSSSANKVKSLLPSFSDCSPVRINFPYLSLVIPCERFNQLKTLLAWVLYILTAFSCFDLLTRPVESKS